MFCLTCEFSRTYHADSNLALTSRLRDVISGDIVLKSIFLSTDLLACYVLAAASPSPPARPQSSTHRAARSNPTRTRQLLRVVNEKLATAGLMLDKVDVAKIGTDGALKVVHAAQERRHAQPAGRDPMRRDLVRCHIPETELDHAAEAKPNPGRPAIHRLNRLEYERNPRPDWHQR